MKRSLSGKKAVKSPFFGWRLKTITKVILEAQKKEKLKKSSNTNLEFKRHLVEGNFVWFNTLYPKIKPVFETEHTISKPERF